MLQARLSTPSLPPAHSGQAKGVRWKADSTRNCRGKGKLSTQIRLWWLFATVRPKPLSSCTGNSEIGICIYARDCNTTREASFLPKYITSLLGRDRKKNYFFSWKWSLDIPLKPWTPNVAREEPLGWVVFLEWCGKPLFLKKKRAHINRCAAFNRGYTVSSNWREKMDLYLGGLCYRGLINVIDTAIFLWRLDYEISLALIAWQNCISHNKILCNIFKVLFQMRLQICRGKHKKSFNFMSPLFFWLEREAL